MTARRAFFLGTDQCRVCRYWIEEHRWSASEGRSHCPGCECGGCS